MPSSLPVKFAFFSAVRKKQQVILNWETATEIDNRGFFIQSKSKNEEWKSIAFLSSKADRGNSSSNLNYSYTDVKINDNTSQYRLQQCDHDGKTEFSDIRSVKAEKLSIPILLYPNPATRRKFRITMHNTMSHYEIKVNDGAGNLVKIYPGYTGTRLLVDGLKKGFYLITVKDLSSGEIFIEKLIVQE